MSCDEFTGQTSVQRVKQTFERVADATLVLRLKNGETIETTEEHPFYVESQGFTAAGELGIGTSIVTRAGPNATLASAQVRNRAATVYNFEVENTHTYFVGQSELWVHNRCDWLRLHEGVIGLNGQAGHTIARHVNKSDFNLFQRLLREPNIPAASTYNNLALAEEVMAGAIRANRAQIRAWVARPPGSPGYNQFVIRNFAAGKVVGRTAVRGAQRVRDSQDVFVLIRRKASNPQEWYIHTSYPN